MVSKLICRRAMLVLVLAATPFLAGSQCVFFFSSGTGSDDDKRDDEQTVAVASGNFGATPVVGVGWVSGSLSGVTGSDGEFQYEVDQPVQFSIGDIQLGRAVSGKSVITTQDLVAGDAVDTTAAVNMERLLQSLDSEPGDGVITIPAEVRAKAVRSDPALSPAIDYLDFADDAAFANAASQLVTVLTGDYPFTGVLVDADTARKSMIR